MEKNSKKNYSLTNYFAENVDKDKIIYEIFKLFDINCIDRCKLDPMRLDSLICQFNESEKCDISVLEEIISLIRSKQKQLRNKEGLLIQNIINYLDNTYTLDMSIEQIANDLHISYFYMCHLFKEQFNISIGTYRTQKRLEKAMKLLVSGNDKISDIATMCGYDNVSYFTELFSNNTGMSPTVFRKNHSQMHFHDFYKYDDMILASKMDNLRFLDENIQNVEQDIKVSSVYIPDEKFSFIHECAIVEYHGVLYASWYLCPEDELKGFTPICGKRSYDKGETWSDLEFICEDKSQKVMYCPPVYGICDDKLYMFVNQMVAPDHIHSLDLYVLNTQTDKFEFLWSRPVPFKINTNVVTLPNGKLMIPGRVGPLDGFPSIPAVIISDSGKIDAEWRLVSVAENDNLPDGSRLFHSETSLICTEDTLYLFNRNDLRRVPVVYVSKDFGETWSGAYSHDIAYIASKFYCGKLKSGQHYMVCNIDKFNRSRLVAYFTDGDSAVFSKKLTIYDTDNPIYSEYGTQDAMHYPAVCEFDDRLYVIATKGYEDGSRGAELFEIDLSEFIAK